MHSNAVLRKSRYSKSFTGDVRPEHRWNVAFSDRCYPVLVSQRHDLSSCAQPQTLSDDVFWGLS